MWNASESCLLNPNHDSKPVELDFLKIRNYWQWNHCIVSFVDSDLYNDAVVGLREERWVIVYVWDVYIDRSAAGSSRASVVRGQHSQRVTWSLKNKQNQTSLLGLSNRLSMHLLQRHLSVLYLLSVELPSHLDLSSDGVYGERAALIAINDGKAHLITGWTICIICHDLHTQKHTPG